MTNPLLEPDGRFKRPSIVGSDGSNRFSDDEAASNAPEREDVLSAPSDAGPPAYQPRYEIAYPHRGRFLLQLGMVGFMMPWLLLLAMTDYSLVGFAGAAVGVTVSLAAVVMGYQELTGMTAGAIDPAGRDSALLGFRLAICGMLLGIAGPIVVVVLIIRGIVGI